MRKATSFVVFVLLGVILFASLLQLFFLAR